MVCFNNLSSQELQVIGGLIAIIGAIIALAGQIREPLEQMAPSDCRGGQMRFQVDNLEQRIKELENKMT